MNVVRCIVVVRNDDDLWSDEEVDEGATGVFGSRGPAGRVKSCCERMMDARIRDEIRDDVDDRGGWVKIGEWGEVLSVACDDASYGFCDGYALTVMFVEASST